MKYLYPELEPYAVYRLHLADLHEVYVEECGNPKGIPAVFLHGGPGSGCAEEHRRYFDPAAYRIILFDQRGSGRSLPLGATQENTSQLLVSDMEGIRHQLGIRRWLLFGGSWGATLALLYAQTHPAAVRGMILRGAFLARPEDMDWFFVALQRLFPAQWKLFTQDLGEDGSLDALIDGYHAALHGEDHEFALRAARSWSAWGNVVVNWHRTMSREEEHRAQRQSTADTETEAAQERMLAKARVETHYAHHRYFLKPDQILSGISLLPSVPVSIVHGRFDLTCTMEAAWLLHRAIDNSRFIQVETAGHLIGEPAMTSALIEETDRMRTML
jgi:proline iminopeptidase